VIEFGTGLVLVALPSVASTLLFGSPPDTPVGLILARFAGAALLALGLACWLARLDGKSRAARGLVVAMVLYNVAGVVLLAYACFNLGVSGIGLWPAFAVHAAMAGWCITRLVTSRS
jgi:riboflavin transporter FmnP